MAAESASTVKIASVVLAYWVISISMLFANKYLVGDTNSEKDVSLFVAWVQCCITIIFVSFLRAASAVLKGEPWMPTFTRQKATKCLNLMRQILPMTFMYVGMLTFNNLCLKHVGVAFFQVARSLTLIFTVILSVIMLKRSISLAVCGCCALVVCGFVLGVDQEKLAGTLSFEGCVYGVLTSLFVSMTSIFQKKSLDIVDHSAVHLTLYNNLNATLLFLPFLFATGQLVSGLQRMHDVYFLNFLLATGALGTALSWISNKQMDLTSPVTGIISSNTKSTLPTVIAVLVAHEYKGPLWWFSIVLLVAGATAYALVRLRESRQEAAAEAEKDAAMSRGDDVEAGVKLLPGATK